MMSTFRRARALVRPVLRNSSMSSSVSNQWRLPVLLSLIAGMSDVIGFVMLGGLFTAHVTGNVVIIAALLVRGGPLQIPHILAVPVFLAAAAGVWMVTKLSGKRGAALIALVLRIHLLLLALVLVFSVSRHAAAHPHGVDAAIAGLLAVSAMACQAALSRLALSGAPATGTVTGNLTMLVVTALDVLSWHEHHEPLMRDASERLKTSVALVSGFFTGCLAGAAASSLGDWAWSFPVAVAAVAVITSRDANRSVTL
jgi:uncharacterized membrane protein YoaK (UPF0700 family)